MSDRFGAMRAELLDAALRELAGADWLKANDWIALNNAIVLAERVGDRDAAAKVTALAKGAMGAVYGRVPSDGEENIPDRRIERVREGVASAIARVAARRASRAPSPAQFAVVPSEAELSEAVAAREGGGIARSSTVRREDPGRE